jgi:hypothetical protein
MAIFMHAKSRKIMNVFALGGSLAIACGATYAPVAAAANAPLAETACHTVAACLFGVNSSTGYGVEGTSTGGNGVVGITTEKATSASSGKAGVSGYDSSTNKNKYNSGVYGTSPYANGVQGKSAHGVGVYGTGGSDGVYGEGAVGVSGYSENSNGAAISAESFTGADIFDGTQDFDGIGGSYGDGVVVDTAYGAALSGTSGRGFPLYLNLTDEGDTIVDAQAHGNDQMVLDASGDLYIAGTLTQNDASIFATKRADGKTVTTYGPREAEPTLEDSGEVALVNGAAHVALDPSFAATIDRSHSYLVFVTPEGENDGVYVTLKNAAGFTIRESHGVRSSLAVEYRIVAHPLQSNKARLAAMPSLFPNDAKFVQAKQGVLGRQAARLKARAANVLHRT